MQCDQVPIGGNESTTQDPFLIDQNFSQFFFTEFHLYYYYSAEKPFFLLKTFPLSNQNITSNVLVFTTKIFKFLNLETNTSNVSIHEGRAIEIILFGESYWPVSLSLSVFLYFARHSFTST